MDNKRKQLEKNQLKKTLRRPSKGLLNHQLKIKIKALK